MAKNLDKLVADVFDPEKVLLNCQEHLYFAKDLNTFPKHPCQKCWECYYILLLGKSSPNTRYEKGLMLEEIVHKMAEQIKKGETPGMLQGHPDVNIQKAN